MSSGLSAPPSDLASSLPPGFSPDLETFFAAWRALRRGAMLPLLRDYLDAPPFRLQPFVSILDVHGPDQILVRLFGTALAAVAGQDFTKKNLEPIYPAHDLARAGAIAWQAVTHPAGYICVRTVRTGQGLMLDCDCIALPLAIDTNHPKCLITFVRFPQQAPRDSQPEAQGVVTHYRFISWIDLGAGTPPPI